MINGRGEYNGTVQDEPALLYREVQKLKGAGLRVYQPLDLPRK